MIKFGNISICSVEGTIRNGNRVMLRASRTKQATVRFKAFKYLLCADGNGLTRTQLFDLVYGHQENGGPEQGVHIFDVHFNQGWARAAEALGVLLKREKRGGQMYLRMVPVAHVV